MNSYLEVVDGIAVGGVFNDYPSVTVPSNWVEITDGAGIGWLWDGTDWTAPAAPMVTVDELRVVRDELLASSDFTQLDDAPYTAANKALWVTYRQSLRDLPDGYTPVAYPTYPTKPEE